MIELYRPIDCPACAEIEEALAELSLARKVITVEPDQQPDGLPMGTTLPAIKDEGQIINDPAAIKEYLEELERIAAEWRKYQSDSCYIDEDDAGDLRFCQ